MANNSARKNNKNKVNINRPAPADDSGCCSDRNYCDVGCRPKDDKSAGAKTGCGRES